MVGQGPLQQDVARLIEAAGVGDVVTLLGVRDDVASIVAAADGNPLYVEQMLSMLTDTRALQHDDEASGLAGLAGLTSEADDEIVVPPTIHALIEARIDRLRREERATLEPAAVVGLEFERQAIESLAPDAVRPAVDKHLGALNDKHLIQQSRSSEAPRFRFHHHLVRDTVYNGLLKRARVNLHTAYVRWADREHGERERDAEADAVLGYHLEQAHRYLKELGPLDDTGRALGADGAQRLSRAGKRALERGDQHAAVNLFRRSCAMLETADPRRVELLPELGEALMGLGDFPAARGVLDEADQLAHRLNLSRIGAASQIVRMFIHLFGGEPGEWGETTLRNAQSLLPTLEAEQAHDELAMAWRLIVLVHGMAGRYTLASEAAERSTANARRAGNARLVAKNSGIISMNALYGPLPARDGIAECEALIRDGVSDRQVECAILCTLAQLKAMNGELDAARALYVQGRATLRDLGGGVFAASTGLDLARVELLGGDLAMAEREVRADYEFLTRMGETYFRSTMAALLSRIARDRGRDADALAYSKIAEEATAADDVESQSLWRSIRAPIVARSGDIDQAEALARDALAMVQSTEAPVLQADALMELAAVLRIAGRTREAREAVAHAQSRYGTKGHIVGLGGCKRWLS
jgi:ATP/maltotriose-dependent transcriptional regulator MalT